MALPARRDISKSFPVLDALTNDLVIGQIWERTDLTPRDRSLITIATLVATYRPEQLPGHIVRGMNNGLTQAEITELITHLAFYAGWPAARSAAGVACEVFEAAAAG